jgi:hypothetical protein
MAWTTPKTNWTTNDGIGDTDLNRIEANTQYLYDQNDNGADHLRNYISGFTVNANSGSEGVYEIRVSGGIWSDDAGNYVDWGGVDMVKTLSATNWTAGAAGQARVDSATYTTNGWFWVFALYNPSTNAHDFAVDDDIKGANLGPATTAGYTLSRRICAVLTTTHITVAGIMPMFYDSKINTIEYAGIATARSVSKALAANTATPVTLTLPGGNDMIPWDSGYGIEDEGTLVLETVVSTSTRVTIWSDTHFGSAHYSGVGPRRYYASASDIHDFTIAGTSAQIYMESTNAATVTVILRSITTKPNDLG